MAAGRTDAIVRPHSPSQRMDSEYCQFMAWLRRLPARLTTQQVAWVLNCKVYDIPVLVAARLLRPLGKPEPNAPKYYATAKMLALADDPVWLDRMTTEIQKHWRHRNGQKRERFE